MSYNKTSYSKRLLKGGKGLVAWQRLARFRRAQKEIMRISANTQINTILDVGAADGIAIPFWEPITENIIGFNYYKTHSNEFKAAYPNHIAITGNITHLPLADNCVDAVVSLETLHFLPDRHARIQALDEIRRVLKPNGIFICSVAVEVGIPAIIKYLGRLCTNLNLSGMSFNVMLRHCFYYLFDISSYDKGQQVGFNAYQFTNDVANKFIISKKIYIPLIYPLCSNIMLACRL